MIWVIKIINILILNSKIYFYEFWIYIIIITIDLIQLKISFFYKFKWIYLIQNFFQSIFNNIGINVINI